MRAAEDGDQV